jgi:3alpha(or 20beta)-hydroxysteroid dehydrogenase
MFLLTSLRRKKNIMKVAIFAFLAVFSEPHRSQAFSVATVRRGNVARTGVTRIMAQKRFENKIALVTGGCSGIGEAVVRGLTNEGAIVVVGDVIDDRGQPLAITSKSTSSAEKLTSLGPHAHLIRLDVRSRADWKEAVKYCEFLGGLDVLVNNAGIIEFGTFESHDDDTFKRVIEVNQCGVFHGIAATCKALKARKGNIINISSIAGLKGYDGAAAYVTSNWAIRGLTKSAALEFARDGIRINSVFSGPYGPIDTHHAKTPMKAGVDVSELVANQPMNRLGSCSEIADAALFLASDQASYITGAELAVDGGASLGPIQEILPIIERANTREAHREW